MTILTIFFHIPGWYDVVVCIGESGGVCVVFFDSGARARSSRGENKLQRGEHHLHFSLAAKLDAARNEKK